MNKDWEMNIYFDHGFRCWVAYYVGGDCSHLEGQGSSEEEAVRDLVEQAKEEMAA